MDISIFLTDPIYAVNPMRSQRTTLFSETITTPHNIPYCIYNAKEQVISYEWSPNSEWLAVALRDSSAPTRPSLSGRWGYYRPPAYRWYGVHILSSAFSRLSFADNHSISDISPDGQYYLVWKHCDYNECKGSIYRYQTGWEVCSVSSYALWLSGDCIDTLPLKDGSIWDIKSEHDRRACAYYETDNERCRKFITPTPTPQLIVSTPTPDNSVYPYPPPITPDSSLSPYPSLPNSQTSPTPAYP